MKILWHTAGDPWRWQRTPYSAQVAAFATGDGLLYGGDPCPVCGAELDWDEIGGEREPELQHPDPQCGWIPSGYPSTRRGWEGGRDPDQEAPAQNT